MAEIGSKCMKALKRAGCGAICLAGNGGAPGLLQPECRTCAACCCCPAVIAAARKGDDALLRRLVDEFEKEGFAVEGAHDVMEDLSLAGRPAGHACAPARTTGRSGARAAGRAGDRPAGRGAGRRGRPWPGAGRRGPGGHRRHAGPVADLPGPPEGQAGRRHGRARQGADADPGGPRVDLPTIGLATVQGGVRAPAWRASPARRAPVAGAGPRGDHRRWPTSWASFILRRRAKDGA